jgi:tetratricopeptide (TPR) repeat protein
MECAQYTTAIEHFKMALELDKRPEYMANLASGYLQVGNYTEAIRWSRKALTLDPENDGAKTALGFAQLGTGDWAEGWKHYESCLGGKYRKIIKIGDEPAWDGQPVESLFIYGEQGLGDEIMYASILPDAIPIAKQIVLECDLRIKGLLQRSFPSIEIRGTRRVEPKPWAEGRTFDAGCAAASLPKFFRKSKDDCPRTPYLIADPERRLQWRALFDSWKKPVVGLCWSGGKAATHKKERSVGLEAFRPFIESHPEWQFVSLQYTDATDEIAASGLPVKHIARAVQSPDYDDTAAFVAELDNIVGIHTTVHHVAGAMGKKSTILVPSRPLWNYATGDSLPWYREQVFHRQRKDESWKDCIRRMTVD